MTLTAGLMKLAAAGLVCGLILSLCGKGSRREVLRFGCACLMTVVLLTLLRQAKLPWGSLSEYELELQRQVEQAQKDYRQTLLVQTEQDLAQAIQDQAALLGLRCQAEVVCAADGQGRLTPQWAVLTLGPGESARAAPLKEWTQTQLGLTEEQVLVEEEAG